MICGDGYLGKSKVPLLFVGKVLEYEKVGGRRLRCREENRPQAESVQQGVGIGSSRMHALKLYI